MRLLDERVAVSAG